VDAAFPPEAAADAPPSGNGRSNEPDAGPPNAPEPANPPELPDDPPPANGEPAAAAPDDLAALPWTESLGRWVDTDRLASSAQMGLALLVLGFIPALFLMTTAYLRIAIVLGVLRQAFG